MYSESLSQFVEVKVTTSVLRTIDKKGGLDKYLLETRDKNLFSEKALELKSKIINYNRIQARKQAAAAAATPETASTSSPVV